MPLYNITPFTLLDFPGEMACIAWFAGCNMRCVFCHNPDIVTGKGEKDVSDLIDFLEKRKGKLTGVVFSGGEPTLYKELPDLIKRVRAMGFKIKLDTNGTRPEVLRELLGFNSSIQDSPSVSSPTSDALASRRLGTQGNKNPSCSPGPLGPRSARNACGVPLVGDDTVCERGQGERLLDYVAMDYKCVPEKTEKLIGTSKFWDAFQESLSLMIDASKRGLGFEVRTTFHADLMTENDLNWIIEDLENHGYTGTYYIQNIASTGEKTIGNIEKPTRTLDPALVKEPQGFTLAYRNF